MPNTARLTGTGSWRPILATIAAWTAAALCLVSCVSALSLWNTDLAIRERMRDAGYNDILALRDDAWLQFRPPLAWCSVVTGVGLAGMACVAALLWRKPATGIAAALGAAVSIGTLTYMLATR